MIILLCLCLLLQIGCMGNPDTKESHQSGAETTLTEKNMTDTERDSETTKAVSEVDNNTVAINTDKNTGRSKPLSNLFYFPFFVRSPFFPSSGLPSPSLISFSRCVSAISAFISTISTFNFSSHSSRVCA